MGWGGGGEEEEAVGQFRSGGAHFFPVSPAAAMQAHYGFATSFRAQKVVISPLLPRNC